jgi:hypothetical protein
MMADAKPSCQVRCRQHVFVVGGNTEEYFRFASVSHLFREQSRPQRKDIIYRNRVFF